MNTEYIECLWAKRRNHEVLTDAECIVLDACNHTEYFGNRSITYGKAFNKLIVPELVSVLHKAGINEFCITRQLCDMLTVYAVMEEYGLKLRGMVYLKNGEYSKDIKQWGESWQKQTVPALRFSFEEAAHENPDC